MSDFEIESDGDGGFEESYSFDAGARNKKSSPRSSSSAAYVPKKQQTASFFGGAVKGGGDLDIYDFDFDEQEAMPKAKSPQGKSSMPNTKSSMGAHHGSNESMNSSGGGGGGLRRSPIHQSHTSDDLASKGSSENALEKAQRMLKMYNNPTEKKAPSMAVSRARQVEEFDENDISLDDSDEDGFASRRKALPKKMPTAAPSASMGNTFQISRSQAMSAGDGEFSLLVVALPRQLSSSHPVVVDRHSFLMLCYHSPRLSFP